MTSEDSARPGGTTGDLGDEARRLAAAVQEWAQRTLPAPPDGHGGPECRWCPLCRFASVLRGEHPELAEGLAEAGTALATAFRAVVDPAAARGRPDDGAPDPARGDPAPGVEHIRLDD